MPGAASEYHVASPTSWLVATGAGGAVVVVVGGGGGADTTGATVVVVVGTGVGPAGVVVVAGAVVDVVVCGARYATRCEDKGTPPSRDARCTALLWVRSAASAGDALDACATPLCSKRKGTPNNAPHSIAATPRRLPRVLCFRRAPPFSGDSAPAPTGEAARGSWRS
jgi:hypothetical protein